MANAGYLTSATGILKIFEIAFVLTSFGLMRDKNLAAFDNVDTAYLGIGIMVACIVVTPLLLICYLVGRTEMQQSIFEVCVNITFGMCLVVYGGMAMNYYANLSKLFEVLRNYGISMSFFSIAAGVVYLVDSALVGQKLRQG